jgi:hypothetical protein
MVQKEESGRFVSGDTRESHAVGELADQLGSLLGDDFGGFGLVEEVAEVEEVLLAGAALGELRGLPLLDELVRGQGGSVELGVRSGERVAQAWAARLPVNERTLTLALSPRERECGPV